MVMSSVTRPIPIARACNIKHWLRARILALTFIFLSNPFFFIYILPNNYFINVFHMRKIKLFYVIGNKLVGGQNHSNEKGWKYSEVAIAQQNRVLGYIENLINVFRMRKILKSSEMIHNFLSKSNLVQINMETGT